MSAPLSRFSSHWRIAGLNYLEMITVSSNALRRVMKEPMRSQALAQGAFTYRLTDFVDGVEQPEVFLDQDRKVVTADD
jgi:hypothetical protein